MNKSLFIGGMIAGGFDATGKYLLVISHSGRGVYSIDSWARVARDGELAYPEDGMGVGIGPIAGERIAVREIDYGTGVLEFSSPDGKYGFHYAEGTLEISFPGAQTNPHHA